MDMEQVRADVADLISYIPRLAELLPPGQARAADDGKHPKVSASPAPWNSAVAAVFMDIHALRGLHSHLALAAHGRVHNWRGSDAHTRIVLELLPDLIAYAAIHCHDPDLKPRAQLAERAAHQLRYLSRQARVVLDELRSNEEPWTRAPGNLACPNQPGLPDDETYCDRPLYLSPGFAAMRAPAVYCLACKDEDGHRMSWPYDAWTLVLTEGEIA